MSSYPVSTSPRRQSASARTRSSSPDYNAGLESETSDGRRSRSRSRTPSVDDSRQVASSRDRSGRSGNTERSGRSGRPGHSGHSSRSGGGDNPLEAAQALLQGDLLAADPAMVQDALRTIMDALQQTQQANQDLQQALQGPGACIDALRITAAIRDNLADIYCSQVPAADRDEVQVVIARMSELLEQSMLLVTRLGACDPTLAPAECARMFVTGLLKRVGDMPNSRAEQRMFDVIADIVNQADGKVREQVSSEATTMVPPHPSRNPPPARQAIPLPQWRVPMAPPTQRASAPTTPSPQLETVVSVLRALLDNSRSARAAPTGGPAPAGHRHASAASPPVARAPPPATADAGPAIGTALAQHPAAGVRQPLPQFKLDTMKAPRFDGKNNCRDRGYATILTVVGFIYDSRKYTACFGFPSETECVAYTMLHCIIGEAHDTLACSNSSAATYDQLRDTLLEIYVDGDAFDHVRHRLTGFKLLDVRCWITYKRQFMQTVSIMHQVADHGRMFQENRLVDTFLDGLHGTPYAAHACADTAGIRPATLLAAIKLADAHHAVLRAQGKCWVNLQAPKRQADSRPEPAPRDKRAWGGAGAAPAPPIRQPVQQAPPSQQAAAAGAARPAPADLGPRPDSHPLAQWLLARGRCPTCTRSPVCAQPCTRPRAELEAAEYQQYRQHLASQRGSQRGGQFWQHGRGAGRGGRGRGRA